MSTGERPAPSWLAIDEALTRIFRAVPLLPSEVVPLEGALGRVLREPVASTVDHPPWDNSAMDGFAVRGVDVSDASAEAPVELRVIEEIPAGAFPSRRIGPGDAARIMTGAPLPEGADSVVRLEHTSAWRRLEDVDTGAGDRVLVLRGDDAGRNVRRRAEDLRRDEVVLEPGTLLRPAELGVLASVGAASVPVSRPPLVAILSNGDELVDLDRFDEAAAGRKIVNSNAYVLAAAVRATGGVPRVLGIAADREESVREHVARALDCDVLVTTAGASVGDHDIIKSALASAGFELHFWRVKIRPGSPFSFGLLRRSGAELDTSPIPVFGLPGNPVSALVTFEVLVRPALRRMQGRREVFAPTLPARAGERIEASPGLVRFLRVQLRRGEVEPEAFLTGPQGSGILTSLTRADGLLVMPERVEAIEAGERVVVLPLGTGDEARPDLGFAPAA